MINYYPQDTGGWGVYKLLQLQKWLADFLPADQAQMCWHKDCDYYLFELVQLLSNNIVFPCFLYQEEGKLVDKCQIPTFAHCGEDTALEMIITNDILFNSPELQIIPVAQFYQDYCQP
jgi:hypothetical protein